jgi:thymidylate synthase ThyX
MPRPREIYLLDPQVYSPETIAVAFAKTSRSPESFHKIASELTGESSAEFNEKWVVGYGHSSVAEHAVLHIAAENISRLAVECLESNRLASYTEKSTRYQQWSSDDFVIPEELRDNNSCDLYLNTCLDLFALYEQSLPAVVASLEKEYPANADESPARRRRIILTAASDVCRFLLPVSAYANVGMTINARALEHAITKMLSHPLLEVQTIGKEIKEISKANLPTLLKYANEQPSLKATADYFQKAIPLQQTSRADDGPPGARLLNYDPEFENHILLAAIVRFSGLTYAQAHDILSSMPVSEKKIFFSAIAGNLNDHEIPIRELEYGHFLFEVILDQGAYLELKRHRMMTQTPSPFTPRFGYSIPLQIQKAGLLDDYERVMNRARDTYEKLAQISLHAASYVLPNAYNRQVLIQSNFRSLYHLLALRSAPNAHFSMRRIAQQMADQVANTSPNLSAFIKTNSLETAEDIENRFFYRV